MSSISKRFHPVKALFFTFGFVAIVFELAMLLRQAIDAATRGIR